MAVKISGIKKINDEMTLKRGNRENVEDVS